MNEMDEIGFRRALKSDYPAICALVGSRDELSLVQPGAKYPWTVKQLARLTDLRRDLMVAELAGRVVAFADLYGVEPQQHAYIGNLVVAPLIRGRGVGRRLIAVMLEIIYQELGVPEARISVFASNRAAYRLYQSLGFSEYEREEKPRNGQHDTMIHMHRPLI